MFQRLTTIIAGTLVLAIFSGQAFALASHGYKYQSAAVSHDVNNVIVSDTESELADLVCDDWAYWTTTHFSSTNYYNTYINFTSQKISATVVGSEVQCDYDFTGLHHSTGIPETYNWTNASLGGGYPQVTGLCIAGGPDVEVYYDGGTFQSQYNEITVVDQKCINNCTHTISVASSDTWARVDPAIIDTYGCTFDQNGFISNCAPDTPIQIVHLYGPNGLSCLSDSGNTTNPFDFSTGGASVDMAPTNNILESIEDVLSTGGELIPDASETIDQSLEYNDYRTIVDSVGTGLVKPFGNGFDSIFPSFTYAGSCFLSDFDITVMSYTATVNMVQYCEYLDMIRSLMDFVFFVLTWLFVYYQFSNAMRYA